MFARKFLLAVPLLGALALGGCATSNGVVGLDPALETRVNAQITAAQNAAVSICKFLPTAQTVAGILSTFVPSAVPGVTVANQVAAAICNAVSRKSLTKGATPTPRVNGVVVRGSFVR